VRVEVQEALGVDGRLGAGHLNQTISLCSA
jgi:hypothetical protein